MDKAVGQEAGAGFEAPPLSEKEKNAIIGGVLLSMLLAALDQTIVSTRHADDRWHARSCRISAVDRHRLSADGDGAWRRSTARSRTSMAADPRSTPPC